MFYDLNCSKAKLHNHKKEETRLKKLLERTNGNFSVRSENQARRLRDLQERIIPANEQEIRDLETGALRARERRPILW